MNADLIKSQSIYNQKVSFIILLFRINDLQR